MGISSGSLTGFAAAPPPVSVTSGGAVGRTTGGAEATENLTRLMTPKGSADNPGREGKRERGMKGNPQT